MELLDGVADLDRIVNKTTPRKGVSAQLEFTS